MPVSYLFPALLLAACGVLALFLARSIQGGNLRILAGYDANRVTDKSGLAAWVGKNLFLMGFLQIIAGLLYLLFPYFGMGHFFIATAGLVARMALGCSRFYQ